MKMNQWNKIRKICLFYFGAIAMLFVCSLLILGLVDYGHKPPEFVGCYAYDALLVGFKCSGFIGSDIVSFGLNYPLYLLYMPLFVVWRPLLVFAVAAMYSPIVLFIIANNKVSSARA